jgi:hypothetical protein
MATTNSVEVPLSGSTGTGNFVGATSPTLITPALGTPSSGILTNTTGYTIANLSDAAWTDFSGTIGFTGFSGSPTLTAARYKLIGKTLFYFIDVSGTSNTNLFTITGMPVAAAFTTLSANFQGTNNSIVNVLIRAQTTASSTTLTMTQNTFSNGWISSNTKGVTFHSFYETV